MNLIENTLGYAINSDPDLAGLGARQKKAVAKLVKKRADQKKIASTLTREQRFIDVRLKDFPAETQKQIVQGRMNLVDSNLYHKFEIGAAGANATIVMLESNNQREVGRSSFQGNKLPDRENLVLTYVRLSYALALLQGDDPAPFIGDMHFGNIAALLNQGTTLANVPSFGGPTQLVVPFIPAALRSAQFQLKLDDKPIVDLPVNSFVYGNSGSGVGAISVGGRQDGNGLTNMRTLIEDQPIGLELRMPEKTVGLPTTIEIDSVTYNCRHFFQVELIGTRTRPF